MHEGGPQDNHAQERRHDEPRYLQPDPEPGKSREQRYQRAQREEEQEERDGEKLPGEGKGGQHSPEDDVQIFQAQASSTPILYQPRRDRRSSPPCTIVPCPGPHSVLGDRTWKGAFR